MKYVYDETVRKRYLENCRYKEVISQIPNLRLVFYERGELLSSPLVENNQFQIVLSGEIEIYMIRDDGTRYSLSNGGKDYILGEVDIFHEYTECIFTEAKSEVVSIAFPLTGNEEELKANAPFMCMVAESLTNKISAITNIEATPATMRERVLTYMKYKCQDCVLKGIEQAAFRIHCSARQLQRILNRLEAEGIVEKTGKGSYRLLS